MSHLEQALEKLGREIARLEGALVNLENSQAGEQHDHDMFSGADENNQMEPALTKADMTERLDSAIANVERLLKKAA